MKNKKAIIPSLFTSLNLFSGFLSLTQVLSGNLITAGWLIVLAAVFDGLDGKIARSLHTNNNFGIEYDSLADIISFGAATTILLYKAYFYVFGAVGVMLSFAFLFCISFRLARYNIETLEEGKSRMFKGLPAPMAALSVVSLMFFVEAGEIFLMRIAYFPLLIMICLLMISKIPHESFPAFSFRQNRRNSYKLIYLLVCVSVVVFFWQYAFFPIMLTYIFHGVVMAIGHEFQKTRLSLKSGYI